MEFAANAAFRPSLPISAASVWGQMRPRGGMEPSLVPAGGELRGAAVPSCPSPGATEDPPRLSLAATLVPGPGSARSFC